MGSLREPDLFSAHLLREQARVLECINDYARGGGGACLAEARWILLALADAEAHVLYPAFSRVALRTETQRLLEDSRRNRDQQLAAVDALARKRASRLRMLGAVQLCDLVRHHGEQHTSLLIPVLASQLPRAFYRSIVHAFYSRYEAYLRQAPRRATREVPRESAPASH